MVTVSSSSVDPVKAITEHDALKFVGTLVTTLLLPSVLWMFINMNTKLNDMVSSIHKLDIQVAVLEEKAKVRHTSITFQSLATRAELINIKESIQQVKHDLPILIKIANPKTGETKTIKVRHKK